MSKIMGIDAGLTGPGLAVVEVTATRPSGLVLLAECFRPKIEDPTSLSTTLFDAARCAQIASYIAQMIATYKPDVIVCEFPTGGAKSSAAIKGMAMATAMTSAIIALSAAQGCQLIAITPMQNKKGSAGPAKKSKSEQDSEQSKWNVLAAVNLAWPGLPWPRKRRKPEELDDAVCWTMADALSCVLTYLRMPEAERTRRLAENTALLSRTPAEMLPNSGRMAQATA